MKTTNKDKNGKVRKMKSMKVSTCKFPFKVKTKTFTQCVDGKTGKWCATSIDKDKQMQTWAYCLDDKPVKTKKIIIKKKVQTKTKKPEDKKVQIKTKKIIIKKSKKPVSNKKTAPKKKKIIKKKAKEPKVDIKELVIKELTFMRQGESFKKDRWRVIAYNKAIRALKDFDGKFEKSDDVKHLHGIGDKILKKIDEIIKTGKLKAANVVRKDKVISAIDLIGNVATIGPVKAKELVEKHNIKSIQDLRQKVKQNPSVLNEKQKIGLKHYEDLLLKIPRSEIDRHNDYLQKVAKSLDKNMEISVVGSYRRGVKSSGDIDVIIKHQNDKNLIKEFVNKLKENNYITDVLSLGGKKHAGICKIPGKIPDKTSSKIANKNRRLDILFTTKKEYPFALFYFTGSGSFNVVIRKKATELKFKLNEYGIKKIGSNDYLTGIKTEKDIFKLLKVEYLEPKDRYPMNIKHI